VSGVKRLVREIHRRSLWQILGIYVVASWLVLQAVDTLAGALNLPDWAPPFALFLLIIGLPIVLATAFIQEGVSRDAPSTPAEPEDEEVVLPEEAATHHRLFTWRNAILGGVLAFALLGMAAAGWMVTRTLGIGPAATLVARGVLDARAPIVLADFESDDDVLGRAATEAFRVDLSQSPNVKLADPGEVSAALDRMARDPQQQIDILTAREIAEREGFQAAIGGRISRAGTGYVFSAEILAAETGEVLTSQRASAADSTEIIEAIDELSQKLRERIGESLGSLRSAPPLARVTTGSLEALRLYSQAVHAVDSEADNDRGIVLLEQAVELDTAFAMAWRKLGVVQSNRGDSRSVWVVPLTRAFEHRRRLSERERYLAMATYYQIALNDLEQAITAYESMLALDPEDDYALNNIALVYGALDDTERREEMAERALRADSTSTITHGTAIDAKVAAGKLDEAESIFGRMADRFEGSSTLGQYAAPMAAVRGDYERAEQLYLEWRERDRADLDARSTTAWGLASLAALHGRLAEAETHSRDAIATEEGRDRSSSALGYAIGMGYRDALVREDPQRGLVVVEEVMEAHPLQGMPPGDRPYIGLIGLYSLAGQPDRARALLADYEAEVDTLLQKADETGVHFARGSIALAEDRYEDAITELIRSERGGCLRRCPGLARAYDAAGQADSAVATYERYLTSPSLFGSVFGDQFNLAPFHERLGELYDEQGDWEKAAEHYARFVELWSEADSDLQPRVQAAQRRLDEIFASRG
jgi:tetratricopeptide (TPR) repeat protein